MPALREVFAEFGVTFDDRELKQGEQAVEGITGELQQLDRVLPATTSELRDVAAGADRAGEELRDLRTATSRAENGFVGFANKIRYVGEVLRSAREIFSQVRDTWGAISGDFVERTREISQWALRLRLPADVVAEWAVLARQAGAEIDDVGDAFKDLQVRAYDALTGTQSYLDAFATVGISQAQLKPVVTDSRALMDLFTDALARQSDEARIAFAADELLGDVGIRLLPILRQGSVALRRQREEIGDLGARDTPRFAEELRRITAATTRWNAVLDSLRGQLMIALTPALEAGVIRLTRWGAALARIARNSTIVETAIAAVAAAVAAAAVPLIASGAAVSLAWLPTAVVIAAAAAAAAGLVLVVDDLRVALAGGDTTTTRLLRNLLGVQRARSVLESVSTAADGLGAAIRRAADRTGVWSTKLEAAFWPLAMIRNIFQDIQAAALGQESLIGNLLKALLGLDRAQSVLHDLHAAWVEISQIIERVMRFLGIRTEVPAPVRPRARLTPEMSVPEVERPRARPGRLESGAAAVPISRAELAAAVIVEQRMTPAATTTTQNVSAPMSVDITINEGTADVVDVIREEIRQERDRSIRQIQAVLVRP